MGQERKLIGGYVRIDLRRASDFGFASIGGVSRSDDELKRDLDGLASAAELRLSKFEDERGDVSVIYEHETVCEHCGYDWTEDSAEYNGGCCAADEANNPDAEAASPARPSRE